MGACHTYEFPRYLHRVFMYPNPAKSWQSGRRNYGQLSAKPPTCVPVRLSSATESAANQVCHRAQEGSRGHGPSWSLTRAVAGKTVTKVIPPQAVETTRAQIAECRCFRAIAKELVEVSERLCDARLAQGDAASQETAKKGASKRYSPSRSTRKSKPSGPVNQWDFEAIEVAARREALRIARLAVARRREWQYQRSPRLPCPCRARP